MWRVLRFMVRLFFKLRWWQQLALLGAAPLCALNLAVATLGETAVFPLSPFHLKAKWTALTAYAKHRPLCLLTGHDDALDLARAAEQRHGLPQGLMAAVVRAESGGRPHRISPAGAMGPAQLMPGTARQLGVRDAYDPDEAIDAGARYLASLLKQKGDVRLAVASYNAGPGAVRGRVPTNGETEVYVARVMRDFDASRAVRR